MKINILDAHDRLTYLKKQEFDIGECCQNLINQRPFGDYAFYIFAHARTADDGVNKRLIWQPRLTKPKAQTNSMLFKVKPGSEEIKVIWMIPEKSMWSQYQKGKLTENKLITESIDNYQNHRDKLEMKEPDDLADEVIDNIYKQISASKTKKGFKLI